jgi:hypothetical protein
VGRLLAGFATRLISLPIVALRSIAQRLPLESLIGGFSLGPLGRVADVPFNIRTLAEAGVIRPMRPDKLARVAAALRRYRRVHVP